MISSQSFRFVLYCCCRACINHRNTSAELGMHTRTRWHALNSCLPTFLNIPTQKQIFLANQHEMPALSNVPADEHKKRVSSQAHRAAALQSNLEKVKRSLSLAACGQGGNAGVSRMAYARLNCRHGSAAAEPTMK